MIRPGYSGPQQNGPPQFGGARARSGRAENHRTRDADGGRTGGPVHCRTRRPKAQRQVRIGGAAQAEARKLIGEYRRRSTAPVCVLELAVEVFHDTLRNFG